jgi:putative peptide zinc metalloprotease protein
LIYDPVRHQYFQITRMAFDLLALWRPEAVADYLQRASSELDRPVTEAEVDELVSFVTSNHLSSDGQPQDPRSLARQEVQAEPAMFRRIVHNYLFFRVPLVRPHAFLVRTLPFVEWLSTRLAVVVIVLLSLAGLYLTSRQWDQFSVTFLEFLSFEGAVVYGISLALIKALHELGHAYTATRLGIRVNTMGIAFMVMMPVLYSDVTDAWRLQQRKHKLAIDIAGIAVELAIAGLSLFLWAFLPDGPWRSAAFVAATSSLLLGLLVNLNPLMRFDGYHILADVWGVPNLDARSKTLAAWWLRERLFGLDDPPPEMMSRGRRQMLVTYAIAAWIYRQALFIGIAIAVYHMFFKVLGVLLFVIEIWWFVLRPALVEIQLWWSMRDRIYATRRSAISGAILVIVLLIALIPWSGNVSLQAVAIAVPETAIYAPRAAQVTMIHFGDGAKVEIGSRLLDLVSPDLDRQLEQAQLEIKLTRLRLDRIAGDESDRSNRTVLEGELARNQAKVAALEADRVRLHVRAPLSGVVRDVDADLRPGDWLDETTTVARVVAEDQIAARGYVSEDQAWRIQLGARAVFVPEDPLLGRITGEVMEVAKTGSRALDILYLSSVYGGSIPSDRVPDGDVRPRSGKMIVGVKLTHSQLSRVVRGTLHINGRSESFAAGAWRQLLRVLIRESGA